VYGAEGNHNDGVMDVGTDGVLDADLTEATRIRDTRYTLEGVVFSCSLRARGLARGCAHRVRWCLVQDDVIWVLGRK